MINAILKGILKMLTSLVNLFLLPVNALFNNLFPNMASSISTFNTFCSTYVGGSLSYFFSLFPPTFRGLLVIWFGFLISYYTVHYSYIAIIKIFSIIQKIKFW